MNNISKIVDEIMKNIIKCSSKKFKLDNIRIKFTYKDNAIFLGNNKIVDIKNDKEPKFIFTKKQYEDEAGDSIIDAYSNKLKNNDTIEIELEVTLSDIETYGDSSIGQDGKEYSLLEIEDFKVTLGDNDLDVKKFINEKDLKKITNFLEEKINENYMLKRY